MVALARAGVTATCTSAASPRYGDLTVDSNLPDVRISLGGPDVNAFTAAVLGGDDAPNVAERTWIPAARPLKDVWVPGADLRGVDALPVLVIGGGVGLEAAVAALVEDLADAEIVVDQQPPADLEEFESRTVAVFNRGVPSFAVDADGTLHTSLMRSCTGWPSGTWIDPPRRTAPDGSNFQLQHWTHTFDYAVACGSGDWRDAGIPSRSAEFSQPLLVVAADHDPASGGLPSWGSLLEIEPARDVALGALKVIGNPIAGGSGRRVDATDGIALRLVETRGRTTDVVIRSGLRNVSAPQRLDLLEQPLADHRGGLTLHGYEIATFGAQLNLPRVLEADDMTLAPDAEPAQPLYARYWLHNRGPAPLGGLPAVAHLHPHQLAVDPDAPVQLQLTAVSDVTDVPLHGKVRLVAPPGWTVEMAELPFMLPPGDFLESIVDVTMPPGTPPGLYPLRAELGLTGSAIPASWRQVVEDVCVIAVGATDDRVLRIDQRSRTRRGVGGRHRHGECHRRHRRVRRSRRRGASHQSVGNVGVDGAQHHRRRPGGPRDGRPAVRRRPAPMGGARRVVGADPRRLRGRAAVLPCGQGGRAMTAVVATVGDEVVRVSEVDASEDRLRSTRLANALPRPGTSEGRQLRRWLVQVLVTARVVSAEAAAAGLTADGAPTEEALLPDVAARLEIGSVAASALEDGLARALFVHVTSGIVVGEDEIRDYHGRNPFRFGGRSTGADGWRGRPIEAVLDDVRVQIAEHLLAVARRREFRRWLDARRAELVHLAPGYEHPGDPRQPDNTHRH